MEELRNCWCEARFRHDPNVNPDNRRRTALAALADHYRRFSNIALILALCMPLWMWEIFRYGNGMNLWLSMGIVLFGMSYMLTVCVMDRWLSRGVSGIDVASMPVAEVCRLAMYYRRKHFQFMVILLPLAVGFILALGWLLSFDMWIILGMACGALAGLSVGVMQFRKFMSEYRDVME